MLTYNGSEKWPVPLSLLVEHDGKQWLKISPINYGLIRTICYDLEVPKNASLATVCGEIENLKKMRNEAAVQKTSADELFDGVDDGAAKKKRKTSTHAKKEVVTIHVAGKPVQCLAARLKQTEDLCILIAEEDLEAVFWAIRQDVPWPSKGNNIFPDRVYGSSSSSNSNM